MQHAQPNWIVFLLMNDLDSLGGSSQLLCTIALALQRAGHTVSVYTEYPCSSDNRYARLLHDAAIPVNPAIDAGTGAGGLAVLLSPARLAVALAVALLSRNSVRHAWRSTGERLNRLLVRRRLSRQVRRALCHAAAEARQEGRTALAHVHRGANGVRWAREAQLPIVYVENSTPTADTRTDWWFNANPSPASNAAKGWRRLRRVAPWIDLIIAGSERAARGVRGQVGYEGPVAILPWMVEPAANIRPPVLGSGEVHIIGTAGRLEAEKGHRFLIQALPRVLQIIPVRLVVAGDGSLRTELEDLAAKVGVRQHVDFLGAQDDVGMERFWDRIELFVLPSLREGSPLVGLEAMARRIAVVATDVGGVRELLDDGRAGCVAQPGAPAALAAAILEVMSDTSRRQSLAQAGYDRFVANYAPAVATPAWLQAYERVLGDWTARPRRGGA